MYETINIEKRSVEFMAQLGYTYVLSIMDTD